MSAAMRPALDLLSQYAAYHRDRRNIVSHFIGVPLIVFAIGVLLARPTFGMGTLMLSPAWVAFSLAAAWYLTRGSLTLGIAVSAAIGILMALAHPFAAGSIAASLAWGFGLFVLGWLIQFIGHWYEGKKPAFVDDAIGLLVAPMFITAEVLFALGWNLAMRDEIERRVGKPVLRDMARIA